MSQTYGVNANGNRSYTSKSAAKVADVAVAWADQGHEPQAYAILDGDNGVAVKTVRVPVTKVRATTKALLAAK